MNKIKKVLGVVAVLVMIASGFGAIASADISSERNVKFSSAIIYVPDNYTNIQDAVDAASDGDMIIVRDGTYNEDIDVNKRLAIQSENGSTNCIVQAANSDEHVFYVSASYVNISGFTITGATWGTTVMYLDSVDSCNISTNNISNNGYMGIWLNDSSNNILTKNNISNNLDGIKFELCNNNNTIIDNNILSNKWYGIDFWHFNNNNIITKNNISNNENDGIWISSFSDNNTLTNNNILNNNGYGIWLDLSSNNIVTNNNVSNNAYGIKVVSSYNVITNNNISNTCWGIELGGSNNTLTNNNISNICSEGIKISYSNSNIVSNNNMLNTEEGISLWCSNNNTITNNKVSNNKFGNVIRLYNSNNNTIAKNDVSSSNWNGIGLAGSNNNTITKNNISNIGSEGIKISFSNSNIVSNNNVLNTEEGISLWCSNNNTIAKNDVSSSNWNGIDLEGSNNNTITKNNITNNTQYGIYLDYSGDNEIYHNNFINNNKQAYDHHGFNEWDKGSVIGGNYWSDHVCHGNPSNGTEPYTGIDTDAGAVDNYPFEEPNGWVIPPLSDLAIPSADISFSPESPIEGEIVIINATIHNIGGENASNVVVRFFDGEEQIGTDQVIGFIGIGDEGAVSVTCDTTGEAGSHVITVKVDPDNEIEESDETNNEASKPITVEPPLLPTISITTDEFEYSPDDIMTITIDIANPTEDSVTFQWNWVVPQFSVCVPVRSAHIPAGYYDTHDFNFTVPNWGPSHFGNVFYVQLLDASGEVLDADAACWAYSQGGEVMPGAKVKKVNIGEIKKTIKRIE